MATTMVHVRVDEKTKRKAAKTLAGMGISVSDAVRMLLLRVAAEITSWAAVGNAIANVTSGRTGYSIRLPGTEAVRIYALARRSGSVSELRVTRTRSVDEPSSGAY
jgi:hypothetical protein